MLGVSTCKFDVIVQILFSNLIFFFPPRLSVIEEVLGKALERVNMDLVFLEDSEHSDLSMSAAGALDSPHLLYHNTMAYVFTWLLIIEAMSQCDPEVREGGREREKERERDASACVHACGCVCVCKYACDARFQTRGALSEWMKELSLFDHLLHGLLKFLNESSKGPTELKGWHENIFSFRLTVHMCSSPFPSVEQFGCYQHRQK